MIGIEGENESDTAKGEPQAAALLELRRGAADGAEGQEVDRMLCRHGTLAPGLESP